MAKSCTEQDGIILPVNKVSLLKPKSVHTKGFEVFFLSKVILTSVFTVVGVHFPS